MSEITLEFELSPLSYLTTNCFQIKNLFQNVFPRGKNNSFPQQFLGKSLN